MSMSPAFDPTPYVHPPQLDTPAILAVARALLAAAPPHPDRRTGKLLDALRAASDDLGARYAQLPAPAKESLRTSDSAVDRAWSALYLRLDAYAQLPADAFPKAARALTLREALFPGHSRAFLALAYATEWAESEKRLQIIDRDHLQADLDALSGPEFVANLRTAHAAYGIALGITHAAAAPTSVNLREALDRTRRAIGRYTFHLASLADEDDDAGLSALRAALKPIDDARAAATHAVPKPVAAALASGGDGEPPASAS